MKAVDGRRVLAALDEEFASTGYRTNIPRDPASYGSLVVNAADHGVPQIDGFYTVSLTVTGPGGSHTETKVDYIGVGPLPVAEFSGSPQSGLAPLTVVFTDLSTGPITSWLWDFGDSSTSTTQAPQHTYSSIGTYTVSLTVTAPGGSDTETKTGYIVVGDTPPVAEFSGAPLTGSSEPSGLSTALSGLPASEVPLDLASSPAASESSTAPHTGLRGHMFSSGWSVPALGFIHHIGAPGA